MMTDTRRPAERAGVVVLLFAVMAGLSLWLTSGNHQAFEYLIARAFVTAAALLAVFTIFVKGRL
jgi:hypothetical protein